MKFCIGLLTFLLVFSSSFTEEIDTSTATTPETTTSDTTTPKTTTIITTPSTTESTTTSTQSTTTSTRSTTTSTTPATTSTTVVPSTSTKAPGPPDTKSGYWNVTDVNGTVCIRANLKILFTIMVKDTKEYIALSPDANSKRSTCEGIINGTQELILTGAEYTLTFIFEKDDNGAFVQNITFSYTLPSTSGTVYNNTKLFNAVVGNSYRCMSTEKVEFDNVTMEVLEIQIQAYGVKDNEDFGTPEECEMDNKVGDIVPIAVGCALLALVVVVLVAYFIGRRRSRQKGYQSV